MGISKAVPVTLEMMEKLILLALCFLTEYLNMKAQIFTAEEYLIVSRPHLIFTEVKLQKEQKASNLFHWALDKNLWFFNKLIKIIIWN